MATLGYLNDMAYDMTPLYLQEKPKFKIGWLYDYYDVTVGYVLIPKNDEAAKLILSMKYKTGGYFTQDGFTTK